jgi:hypothetical protein
MTIPQQSNNYAVAVGTSSNAASTPVYSEVSPSSTNVNYPVGQRWINMASNQEYVLTSVTSFNGTSTANWEISAGGSISETLTGNSGGAVPAAANNINTVGAGSITIVGSPGTNTLTTELTGLTNHNLLIGAGTTTITKVAPSATAGIPVVSAGAAADPAFGTAVVAGGGTGDTSFTAYSVITGGTTATGALQNVSGVGTAGQVLTSQGAAALPQWANPSSQVYVFAYLNANVSDVTGDGTPYTIVYNTAEVNTGTALNLGTGVFTAPITGNYFVSIMTGYNGFDGSTHYGPFTVINRSGGNTYVDDWSEIQPLGNFTSSSSFLIPMTASQTLTVTAQVDSGAKTISLGGDATARITTISIVKV